MPAPRAKTNEQPLISPYQSAIGTPQLIEALNVMDATLVSMDGKLESIDGKLESMDGKLESIDGKLESVDGKLESIDGKLESVDGKLDLMNGKLDLIHEDQHAGFTTLAGLLREIRDRLPVSANGGSD